MNATTYVFSGTGTSLAMATNICNAMENTEIISIPHVLKSAGEDEIKIESSKIGFIFPCYFGSVPNLVLNFIRKANLENVKYIFTVVTCGGNTGIGLKTIAEELDYKGKKLNYGKSISLSSNYIVAWYYYLTCKKDKQLENALQSFEYNSIQFAKDIVSEKSDIDKSSYFLYKISRLLSPKSIAQDTRTWDIEFSANEKCNKCGICSKVCPVNNIRMVNQKPEFQHNCQRCMACIQYCPSNAISFNGKSLNKQKYYHPDFPAKKMIEFNNYNEIE